MPKIHPLVKKYAENPPNVKRDPNSLFDLAMDKKAWIPSSFYEGLAGELIQWAKKDDSLIIEEFHLNKEIPPGTWDRWIKINSTLSGAYKMAKAFVGARREKKALNEDVNSSLFEKLHPLYSEKYAGWKIKLKQTDEQNRQLQLLLAEKEKIIKKETDDIIEEKEKA